MRTFKLELDFGLNLTLRPRRLLPIGHRDFFVFCFYERFDFIKHDVFFLYTIFRMEELIGWKTNH